MLFRSHGRKNESKTMVMYSLLMDKRYVVLFVASLIGALDFIVSLTHLVQYAIDLGITRENANWLPTFASAGNVIGRLLFGRIFDYRFVKPLSLYKLLMIITGIIALIGSLSSNFTHLIIFAIMHTIFDGGYKAQMTVICLEITGKSRYMEGWTMLLCGQSVMLLI